jgi:hypothetical protein
MAEIPPPSLSSANQAGHHARDVSRERDAGRSDVSHGITRGRALGEVADIVETDDGSTQIYSDAEGTGSQGRPFEEPSAEASEEQPQAEVEGGLRRDDEGNVHLDIEI